MFSENFWSGVEYVECISLIGVLTIEWQLQAVYFDVKLVNNRFILM